VELAVERLHVVGVDENLGPRAAVAVVLGEVERNGTARHLEVSRPAGPGLVLPVDSEPEPVDVEGLGEGGVEDSQHGNRWLQRHGGLPDSVRGSVGTLA
jgi:hypothetical protein